MEVTYLPQVNPGKEIHYQFKEEQILASFEGVSLLFDLSHIEEGKEYSPYFPIVSAERVEGNLFIKLISWTEEDVVGPVTAENSKESLSGELITLTEIKLPEPELSELEKLQTEKDALQLMVASHDGVLLELIKKVYG
ncbi:MAG: hypothetical protein F6I01_002115 [Aerococcus sanguinicola]